jgi:hypothetical protein
MYWDNSDGAGFMSLSGGEVVGQKFSSLEEFLEEIYRVPKKGVVIGHFRIATHGGKTVEYAQPFPFPIKKKEELFLDKWTAPLGVAHNGVISGFGQSMHTYAGASWYQGQGQDGKIQIWKKGKWVEVKKKAEPVKERNLSDTQDFLWFLSNSRSLNRAFRMQDKAIIALLRRLVSSRFAFLSQTGKVRLLGNWKHRKGLWFSNLYWENATDPADRKTYAHGTATQIESAGGTRFGAGEYPFFRPGQSHYPDYTRKMLIETNTKVSEIKKNGESDWKVKLAAKHCANWGFCTQFGKKLGGCISGESEQKCAYFESAVLPEFCQGG